MGDGNSTQVELGIQLNTGLKATENQRKTILNRKHFDFDDKRDFQRRKLDMTRRKQAEFELKTLFEPEVEI